MKKVINKTFFLFFMIALFTACKTLPENIGTGSLLIIKLNLKGGGIGISLGFSSSGSSSLGIGSYIFTGEAALITLKNLESEKLIEAHYFREGFSFFANMPGGRYQLHAAEVANYNRVILTDYNIIFEVEEQGTHYLGAYVLYFRAAQDPSLDKVPDKEEEINRVKLTEIINIQLADKGWVYE